MNNNKNFSTSDLSFLCYLLCKGVDPINKTSNESGKVSFVFSNEKAEKLWQKWGYSPNKLMKFIQLYENNRKRILRNIKGGIHE